MVTQNILIATPQKKVVVNEINIHRRKNPSTYRGGFEIKFSIQHSAGWGGNACKVEGRGENVRCETLCGIGAECLKAGYSKRWGSADGVLMGFSKRSKKLH